MILIAGIPSEPPVRLVCEAAEALGVPHVVLGQRQAAVADLAFDLRADGSVLGWLHQAGVWTRLETVEGIYVRLMDPEELPESRGRTTAALAPARRRSQAFHAALIDWLEVTPARVMNRTSRMASNSSKPFQAMRIRGCGLQVPETLVTNDVEEVRAFRNRYGRVIYKSISSVRSIVRELAGPDLLRLERVRNLPTQFQEWIPGVEVRVHVVGDELFATEIRTEAIDYRYAARDGLEAAMEPTDLPASVRESCFAVSRELELPFCGLDLRRTPGGAYYCFEANPQPGYSYFQESTGQPIAAAIVRYLAGIPS